MKIWYIDDDQEMQEAIRLMVKMLGHSLRPFLAARDAVRILEYGEKPDAVLLDIQMPVISGLDFLEFVRRRPDWNNVAIVMLSTEFMEDQIDRAMALGADGYLTKPVSIEDLEKAFHTAMEKRRP